MYSSGNNLNPGPLPPELEVQCKRTCITVLSVVSLFIEIVVMKMFTNNTLLLIINIEYPSLQGLTQVGNIYQRFYRSCLYTSCLMDSLATVDMLSTYHKLLLPLPTPCHDCPVSWMSLL